MELILVVSASSPGEWQLIVDLSSPEGFSVNDGVYSDLCSLNYVSIEDALREVSRLGAGALLAKIDIRKAYRNIPVHPVDRLLLGMTWEGSLFIDATLPFGLRSAPKIFSAVADAAEWMVRDEGVTSIMHYLDDFLLVGPPGSDTCQKSMDCLLRVFEDVGLPIAPSKLEGPTTKLTFLGIEVDTVTMTIRLPAGKLAALQEMIRSWLVRKSCTRRELESLVGSLSHACCVVRPGKTFLRRLFELLSIARHAHNFLRLNATCRSDLFWWYSYLGPLNHASFFRTIPSRVHRYSFASDASGSIGCGAIWASSWFQFKWAEAEGVQFHELGGDSITFKELLPIVLAVAVWGPLWRDSSVLVYCDNQGAVSVVNSGYSRVPRIMHLLRCLFFIRARFNVELIASHIPGKVNCLADAISRDQLAVLFSQVPSALWNLCQLPTPLVSLLLDQHLDWTSHNWRASFEACFPPV